jgi:hypothetical protein
LGGFIGVDVEPRARSARQAVEAGVGRVIIGGYKTAGDLAKLLSGASGTTIV